MQPKGQENRGGRRPGAGRKPKGPKNYDEQAKKAWLKATRKKAREAGKTYQEVALDMLYDQKTQAAVRASIIKEINSVFVVPESRQKVDLTTGPAIYLPEVLEPPEEFSQKEEPLQ